MIMTNEKVNRGQLSVGRKNKRLLSSGAAGGERMRIQ